jgi:hypothetical protein
MEPIENTIEMGSGLRTDIPVRYQYDHLLLPNATRLLLIGGRYGAMKVRAKDR